MFIVLTMLGEQICKDVDSAINKRMVRKWSVLKTSTDKQLLEQFLTELTVSLCLNNLFSNIVTENIHIRHFMRVRYVCKIIV